MDGHDDKIIEAPLQTGKIAEEDKPCSRKELDVASERLALSENEALPSFASVRRRPMGRVDGRTERALRSIAGYDCVTVSSSDSLRPCFLGFEFHFYAEIKYMEEVVDLNLKRCELISWAMMKSYRNVLPLSRGDHMRGGSGGSGRVQLSSVRASSEIDTTRELC